MPDTLTIRLDPEQRRQFDAEALARGVGPSTLARELLSERLREIRRARIYRESAEAGERCHASLRAGENVEMYDLDPLVEEGRAPYEGTVGGERS
jgi:hypothetical protein